VAAVSGLGPIRVWDVRTRKEVASLSARTGSGGSSVAFSPSGRLLATSDWNNDVQLWDLASKRQAATLRGRQGKVLSLAFSPDGRALATGGEDSTVRLWDVPGALAHAVTPRATLRGHTGPVDSVSFSRDGKLLASGSSDDTAKLWNPFPPPSRSLFMRRRERVTAQQFSPSGLTLALGYAHGTVELWDTSTRTRLAVLKQGPGEISDADRASQPQRMGKDRGLLSRSQLHFRATEQTVVSSFLSVADGSPP
jgi:WD40 repeat protein